MCLFSLHLELRGRTAQLLTFFAQLDFPSGSPEYLRQISDRPFQLWRFFFQRALDQSSCAGLAICAKVLLCWGCSHRYLQRLDLSLRHDLDGLTQAGQ